MGLSVPYGQVLNFQRSAAVQQCEDERHPFSGVCQWVADNFDYNEDMYNGENTIHVMGIIKCQTPKTEEIVCKVPRKTVAASDLLKASNFGDIVQSYKLPNKSSLGDVVIQKINPVNVNITTYDHLDTLWLFSSQLCNSAPNWQGFMTSCTACKGNFLCTSVIYNPMIPLNPQTNEAVFSTMCFVLNEARKHGQCCAMLTFDQPLYIIAYRIKQDSGEEFHNIFLRLGGFYQLMSFLGSACKIMEESGIEDLWSNVYARNSLPKRLEGKAYHKALRACLLTDAALHIVLLESSLLRMQLVNSTDVLEGLCNEDNADSCENKSEYAMADNQLQLDGEDLLGMETEHR